MQYTCVDLIPQSYSAQVSDKKLKSKLLNLMVFILNELVEAIINLQVNKKFSCLDPHVGETSCQIRALKILLISRNDSLNLDCHKRINELNNIKNLIILQVIEIQNSIHTEKFLNIFEFFKKSNCLFTITEIEKYILV